ncbi:hypothetical protein pb186bvf_014946 [Paramecium bursaria]
MKNIQDLLLEQQYTSESLLFQIIYDKRRTQELSTKEQEYFKFVQRTFQFDVLSFGLLIAPIIHSYRLLYLMKTDPVKVSKGKLRLFLAFTVPAFNIFFYSLYRRYYKTPPFQKELELKYINELRPRLKIIDSSSKQN